ncbi:thiamine-phosphate kinase [Ideonella sp. DXS22W]|uniref:Thiamine-monophosphate kinase n=1 Tax=Pseudaquabacterium inlustre TaxID=2984192 RepID=A0ABU9CIR0_9BURK
MSLGEFDLIAKYFTRPQAPSGATVLGVGDDCALLQPTAGRQWAVSSDMLVEGRHFLSTVAPERLGHKALAVNLSDLAACGADPVACTLALALPRVDEAFLAGLSQGFFALADAHGIALVGGDTTAGPLNLCITVFGELPAGQALRRDGARVGDALWVSHPVGGGIGDARLALEVFRGTLALPGEAFERVRRAMELPQPRVALGRALRGLATAAIDVSDGLAGDLGHILRRSGVAAVIDVDALPVSPDLASQPLAVQRAYALAGGDDYELLFTAPADADGAVRAAAEAANSTNPGGPAVAVRRIGRIEAADPSAPALRLLDGAGRPLALALRGFDHFATP